MGVGLVSFTCLDPLLLLCLERSEIHRKGTNLSLAFIIFPIIRFLPKFGATL